MEITMPSVRSTNKIYNEDQVDKAISTFDRINKDLNLPVPSTTPQPPRTVTIPPPTTSVPGPLPVTLPPPPTIPEAIVPIMPKVETKATPTTTDKYGIQPTTNTPPSPPGNGIPPLITTEEQTNITSAGYPSEAVKGVTTAIGNQAEHLRSMQKLLASLKVEGGDDSYNAVLGKYLAAQNFVEDLLKPTNQKTIDFFNAVDTANRQISTAQNDLAEFQKTAKIDPNRYMNNMPTTQKVFNALAVFIEGMAAANAVGKGVTVPTTGLFQSQIDKAIAQDIEFQKMELGAKEKGLTTDVNRYKDNLALLKDKNQAELKTRADYLSLLSAKLRFAADQVNDKMTATKFEEEALKTDTEAAKTLAELNKKVVQRVTVKKISDSGGLESKEIWDRFEAQRSNLENSVKEESKAIREIEKLEAQLEEALVSGNAQLFNQILGQNMRLAAGPGALSESDKTTFGANMSVLSKIKDYISRGATGKPSDEVIQGAREIYASAKNAHKMVVARAVDNSIKTSKALQLPGDLIAQVVSDELKTWREEGARYFEQKAGKDYKWDNYIKLSK